MIFCDVEDVKGQTLDFKLTTKHIERGIHRGSRVLVHCQKGISRSTSIVLAYLIKCRKMTLSSACDLVKGSRQVVRPNRGFLDQLSDWEKQHLGYTTDDPFY